MHANTKNKEIIDLQTSLQAVYRQFDCYKKPSANLTCLDYGPTQEELEVFTKFKLYELPPCALSGSVFISISGSLLLSVEEYTPLKSWLIGFMGYIVDKEYQIKVMITARPMWMF